MFKQMGNFKVKDRMIAYIDFIPRFYNLCLSYGFEPGKIMPSRAFCADENQGYPTILITKHFGTYPFNHGRVGAVVSTGRHGPHAHHGKDLTIIQASHVGYDPETNRFGAYRRSQIEGHHLTHSCGKICAIIGWYKHEYDFAAENIKFAKIDGDKVVIIDNQLLNDSRENGIFLHLDNLIALKKGEPEPLHVFSTSKAFAVHPEFESRLPESQWTDKSTPIGKLLTADLFYFRRNIPVTPESMDHLEYNLSHGMAHIVTSAAPELTAAQFNTQIEFDRTYRSIVKEQEYQGKNLAFIAGINIDISPSEGELFPMTKFVPWAAYIQTVDGKQLLLEQDELMKTLSSQSSENNDQIDLEEAIRKKKKKTVKVDI